MPATKPKSKTAAKAKAPVAPVAIESLIVEADEEAATLTVNGQAFALSHEAFLQLRKDVDAQALRFVH